MNHHIAKFNLLSCSVVYTNFSSIWYIISMRKRITWLIIFDLIDERSKCERLWRDKIYQHIYTNVLSLYNFLLKHRHMGILLKLKELFHQLFWFWKCFLLSYFKKHEKKKKEIEKLIQQVCCKFNQNIICIYFGCIMWKHFDHFCNYSQLEIKKKL